jgi:uncharacterized protein YecA (UPF0149 family)
MEAPRITIPLRLAPELHARLKALAANDQRSLNAFIALALARLAGVAPPPPGDVVAPKPVTSARALPVPSRVRKVGPNQPCPCGSGTKYKKCHGRG